MSQPLSTWRAALASPALEFILPFLSDTETLPVGVYPCPGARCLQTALCPVRPLGSGLFGRVFLASFPRSSTSAPVLQCAVKQMDLQGLYAAPGPAGMGQAHRASRELRALRLVTSLCGDFGARYIVKLLGHCSSSCRRWLYLHLELCPGGTLLQRLRTLNIQVGGARAAALRGLPLAEARGHLACLLAALCALHDLGIAHRDIRPANVGLGADGLPRLLDFNLCRGGGGRGAASAAVRRLALDFMGGAEEGACAATAAGAAASAAVCPREALLKAAAQWTPPQGNSACVSGSGSGDDSSSGSVDHPPPAAVPTRFCSPTQAAAFAAWCAVHSSASEGSSTAPLRSFPPRAHGAAQRRFSIVGSPVHMAPEVAERDMSTLEHALAADMFSYGVTAYQLITGRCPSTGTPAWEGEEEEEGWGEWEGGKGEGAAVGAAEGEKESPTKENPFLVPPALLAQCPSLASFFQDVCARDPAKRPTPHHLLSHPFFSQHLDDSRSGSSSGTTTAPLWWNAPLDWAALFQGSQGGGGSEGAREGAREGAALLPPLVPTLAFPGGGEGGEAGALATGGGQGQAPFAWGGETYFFQSPQEALWDAERQAFGRGSAGAAGTGESSAGAGEGEGKGEGEEDPLLVAYEFLC